ncbi:E3 ubiquitin-protein ligase DCST1-like, partial [Pyxicephalus adspersus]
MRKEKKRRRRDRDYVAITIEDDNIDGKRKLKKPKLPNTTIRRFVKYVFPRFFSTFLFSDSKQFALAKFFLGFGFGGLLGLTIYLMLIDTLKLPYLAKTIALYSTAGTFAAGWSFSSYFRCSTLIIIPNLLGKEGRAFLFILAMTAIYAGPGANLQHNLSEVPRSIGCTTELHINNTKLLWKVLITPMKSIIKNIIRSRGQAGNKVTNIKSSFGGMKEQVESTSGYDLQKEQELVQKKNAKSFLEKFDIKQLLRCDYVIDQGITKCYEWFEIKYDECLGKIVVPVVSHILCLPLKFSFICKIMNLLEGICQKYLPKDEGFGDVYQKTISTLKNFGSKLLGNLTMKKEKNVDAGSDIPKMSMKQKVLNIIEKKRAKMESLWTFLKSFLVGTFIFVFISALNYTKKYNMDMQYDNCYVTTYFRQIDAQRRKHDERFVLPMKKGETSKFIFPFSPMIHGPEMSALKSELLQCAFPIILLTLLIIVDRILFHILDVIRLHGNVTYVFQSHHKLEMEVGGNGILADLLRNIFGALNSSSNTMETTKMEKCLPNPIEMTFIDYLGCCAPVFGMICLSVLQVYLYRLRRVVASFFYPNREKSRVLFLYNGQLRVRRVYATFKRKEIMNKARISRKKLKTFM